MEDASDIGQDKTYKDATEKYDAKHGTYKDPVDGMSEAERLPQGNLPQAPDPNPFSIGSTTPSSTNPPLTPTGGE